MSFTQITVTGTYSNPDNSVPSGTVTFTPTSVMQQAGEIVPIAPTVGTLDVAGSF